MNLHESPHPLIHEAQANIVQAERDLGEWLSVNSRYFKLVSFYWGTLNRDFPSANEEMDYLCGLLEEIGVDSTLLEHVYQIQRGEDLPDEIARDSLFLDLEHMFYLIKEIKRRENILMAITVNGETSSLDVIYQRG